MYPLCFISNSSKKLLHHAINKNSVNKLFTLLVNVCQGVHISPRIHILYNISILYCELQRSLTNDMNGNLLPSECLLIYFQYKKMSKVSKKDQQYRCSVKYWQTFTNSYQYQQFITKTKQKLKRYSLKPAKIFLALSSTAILYILSLNLLS